MKKQAKKMHPQSTKEFLELQEPNQAISKRVNTFEVQLMKELMKFIKNSDIEKQFLFPFSELSFSDFLSNKLLLVFIIRKGIPYSIFTLIQELTPFSLNEWASYLNMSNKSLSRYRQHSTSFKSIHTEKIIEIAEVTNLGLEVFGDFDKFGLWLETPNYALGNLKPFELLKDSYGKEMVIGELSRIDHGILV
jgi:putative toxin-antitoxin system antitoxin component (TIGR02293 family)